MKQPQWFNRGTKNYYLIDTRTIISWALLSLLNNIYLVTEIHVFMYLKDIIRGGIRMDNASNTLQKIKDLNLPFAGYQVVSDEEFVLHIPKYSAMTTVSLR